MPIKFLNDVAVDSSVLYVDTINNRVGVGVASPAVKLHAGSTSTSGVTTEEFRLQSGTSSGNGGTAIANLVTGNFGTSGIYFGNNTTYSSQPVYLQYQRSSNVTTLQFDNIFKIDQNASSIFYINSSSNVGIGTTSPTAKLQVEDSISSGSLFKITTSAAGALQPIFDARAVSNGDTHYDFNVYKSSTKKIQIISANTASITQIDGTGGFDLKGHLKTSLQTVNGGGVLQLHRYGALSLNDDDAYAHIPPSALYINTLSNTSTDYLLLIANQGSDKLAVDLNGNVGIGTTAPADILHVDGARSNFNGIKIGENSTNIQFIDDGKLAVGNNDWLIFTEGGQEFMRAGGQGNVGIGTTSPSQKLHVSGNARVTGAYYDSNNSAGTSGQVLSSTATGTDWIDQGDIIVGEADKAKSVVLRVKNSTASPMTKGQVICEAVSASPPSGNLIEVALADNNGTNTMPALGILNEDLDAAGGANDEGDAIMFGKVSGIDTSAFDVGDEVFVSDTPGGLTITKPTGVKYIQKVGVVIRDDNTNGTIEVFGAGRVNDVPTPLYVDHANQRLGIGATSPSARLEVVGPYAATPLKVLRHGDYGNVINIGRNGVSETANIGYPADATINLSTAGSERMRITSSGNVGIGTTSPRGKLDITNGSTGQTYSNISGLLIDVNGTSNSYYGLRVGSSTGNSHLAVTNAGNVGIGTASPGKKLDINGDTIFRGELVIDGDSSVHSRINQTSSYLEIVGNNTDSADGTRMWIGTGQTDQGFYVNASNHSFRDNSSNTRMIINGSSGNVGIGTTSPLSQLTVQSSNATAYDATIDDGQDSDGATIMAFNADNTTTDSFAQILFRNRSSNVGVSRIVSLSTAAASTALAFVTENSNTKAEKMRIASDGAIKFNTYGAGTLVTDSSGNITVSSGGGAGGPYLPLAGGTMSGNLEISKSSAKLILTDSSAGQASVDIRNSSLYARWILDIDDLFRVYNQTSGFDAFAIKSSGNVGIGTASPGEKLEVDGYAKVTALGINSSPDAYLSSLNARLAVGGNIVINTNLPQLYLRANSTSNTSDIRYQNSLKLTNGSGSTHLTVTSGGDVGIGTTSPSNKLDVNGNIEASRIILPTTGTAGGGTVTTPAGKLDIRSDSTWSNSAIIARTTTNQNPVLAFYRPSGGSATSYPWWLEANGSTFQIKTGSAANIGSETVSTKVTINSSGNVGINTTNPQTGLQLSSSADNRTVGGTDTGIIRLTNTYGSNFGAGGEIQFGLADVSGRDVLSLIKGSYTGFSSGNYGGDLEFHTRNPDGLGLQQRMTITDAGNVGIGTTSPTSKLTVVDDILLTGSSPSLTLTDATSSFVIKTNTAGEGILQTSGTSKPIRFFRNNGSNESMRINGDGNVGIGTTSPAAKLEVEGSDHLFQLSTAATAGSPYLSFNQAGTRRSFIQHADSGDTLKLASEYGGIDFYTGTSGSETEKMTIQSNGNVGIGITAPVVKLHIGTSSGSGSTTEEFRIQTGTGAGYGGNAVVNLNTGAFGKSGIYFGNNGSLSYANQDSFLEYDDFSGQTKLNFGNTLTINKGTSSAIYIDSFGRVGLGTTSPQYQLQLSTNSAAKPTSSSWTVVSDERVKTNIRPYETGLQELLQIEPKLFDYNGKAGFDAKTKNNIGVIAQEIKDVMPETVKKYNAKLNEEDEEDTELYNFDSHALTFALINSVKELNAKIKNLETKIQTLENQ